MEDQHRQQLCCPTVSDGADVTRDRKRPQGHHGLAAERQCNDLSAEEPTCGAILAYAAGGDNSPKSAMLLVPVVPVAREAVGG